MTLWTVALQAPLTRNSPGKNIGVGWYSLLQGNLPDPGIEPKPPILQADSLPSEPLGKPKNTGVCSLLNWDLLHCRQILYQLSYQRSPKMSIGEIKITELEHHNEK